MNNYEHHVLSELRVWQKKMLKKPGIISRLSKRTQDKMNSFIPEKIHDGITTIIKQMIRGVLFGAKYTTAKPLEHTDLFTRENKIKARIKFYRTTAAVEGGITGAGGLLAGLADFPLLLAVKLKLLYEIAAFYGYDLNDYKERIYLLHIFELAFSSREYRKEVYIKLVNWEEEKKHLPENINEFDWRRFQQEYRDFIDLAKMAQLIPVVGAPVGIVANYSLVKKLGDTAMNAYRMRLLGNKEITKW